MANVNPRVRIKIVTIAIGLALTGLIAFLLWDRSGQGRGAAMFLGGLLSGVAPPVVGLPEESPTTPPGAVTGVERYHDPDLGFSFEIPEGFNVTSFSEGEGEMLLAQGQGQNQSFQIYTTSFDESGPITPERIRRDLPAMAITNPRQATLAGIPALVFTSRDSSLGDLTEIWFVHSGSLYQITAPADFEEQLAEIMATWRFS